MIDTIWRCDICRKKFEKSSSVRNEIQIVNGKYDGYYAQVCEGCSVSIGEAAERLKPEAFKKIEDKN